MQWDVFIPAARFPPSPTTSARRERDEWSPISQKIFRQARRCAGRYAIPIDQNQKLSDGIPPAAKSDDDYANHATASFLRGNTIQKKFPRHVHGNREVIAVHEESRASAPVVNGYWKPRFQDTSIQRSSSGLLKGGVLWSGRGTIVSVSLGHTDTDTHDLYFTPVLSAFLFAFYISINSFHLHLGDFKR